MRLCSVVIMFLFLCIISISLRDITFVTATLQKVAEQKFMEYSAKRFISQSFKNTCNQKGFQNLQEWESVCNALYELDSIDWEISDTIVHGKWSGAETIKNCSGEVYCRINFQNDE